MAIASNASNASQLLSRSRRRTDGAFAADKAKQILVEVTRALRACGRCARGHKSAAVAKNYGAKWQRRGAFTARSQAVALLHEAPHRHRRG
jgi:hypothetical protein